MGQIELVSSLGLYFASDGEASVLELWRMCTAHSLPLLVYPDPEWLYQLSIGQIVLFNHVTVCKQKNDV